MIVQMDLLVKVKDTLFTPQTSYLSFFCYLITDKM